MKTPGVLEAWLDAFAAGAISRDELMAKLGSPAHEADIEDIGFARIDHDRARRRGFPEVVFGLGKQDAQIVEIVSRLAARNDNLLCTRCASSAAALALDADIPELRYDARAQVLYRRRDASSRGRGEVLVVSAGTSDQRVACEALRCAEVMGNQVALIEDVGVAGLTRVLEIRERLREAAVVICVAGMEAALPSVVAGLVEAPVIAVPTSVGYGATFEGLSALLGALTACAAGVVTVNIDNGFGAAYAASLITRTRER